jgi:hypothetical protein
MGFQIQGNSGIIAEVDANRRQLTVPGPIDVGALGSYCTVASTGNMAAGLAAAAPIFSVRWSDSSGKLMLVRKVSVAVVNTTAFTAGIGLIDMVVARSFNASDTGGAGVSLTVGNAKRRTSFGTSLIAATEMRVATTATLTAGTRTLDANAMGSVRFGVNANANSLQLANTPIFNPDWSGEWPLVLAQNEGFVIRATLPATGVWVGDIAVEWAEVPSF